MEAAYSRVLALENCSAVDTSMPDKTTPATMAIKTAARLPIQNDFIICSLPKLFPGKTGKNHFKPTPTGCKRRIFTGFSMTGGSA